MIQYKFKNNLREILRYLPLKKLPYIILGDTPKEKLNNGGEYKWTSRQI